MSVKEVIILGVGPCGLSAAIALAKTSREVTSPGLRITMVELRPSLQTIGGTINLTPLAMRYLDYLGVGPQLRGRAIDLHQGLDYISIRTGQCIGNIWGNIGSIRIKRDALVESLLQSVYDEYADMVTVQWGRRVTDITEQHGHVQLRFEDGSTLESDVLIGCDGLHSAARRLWVEPERAPIFTGRVLAMGWGDGAVDDALTMTLPTGAPALVDTALYLSANGVLLASRYEPTRSKIYFANVMLMDEPEGESRDGWKLRGDDKDALREEVVQSYQSGCVKGLPTQVARCKDWHLYPSYILPRVGRWSRGRVLLMGDAAHAMPPQGESTGLAIEDGVLLAHVLQRSRTRTIAQLWADFEAVRRPTIDGHYQYAAWAMKWGFVKTSSWTKLVLLEWGIWLHLLYKRWSQEDHFSGDVRKITLPE